MSVAIVDYGSGNLHSAQKAFERAAREAGLAREVLVTADPEAVARAEHIVLPGVGAFADCRRGLDAVPGMVEALEEAVRRRGRPFLGICVGMQLMASRGLEHEIVAGLDWIPGDVATIRPDRREPENPAHGLEHARRRSPASRAGGHPDRRDGPARLFRALVPALSAASLPTSSRPPITAARSRRSSRATISIGTQFHPEKSQTLGLALIANFLKWRP